MRNVIAMGCFAGALMGSAATAMADKYQDGAATILSATINNELGYPANVDVAGNALVIQSPICELRFKTWLKREGAWKQLGRLGFKSVLCYNTIGGPAYNWEVK